MYDFGFVLILDKIFIIYFKEWFDLGKNIYFFRILFVYWG